MTTIGQVCQILVMVDKVDKFITNLWQTYDYAITLSNKKQENQWQVSDKFFEKGPKYLSLTCH